MMRDRAANMHHEAWKALRRVAETGVPGTCKDRDALMRRGLIDWNRDDGCLRLTKHGAEALRKRNEELGFKNPASAEPGFRG